MPSVSGGRVHVVFAAGEPHPVYEGSGWNEVRVREVTSGVESTLLYEPELGGRISGLLRLRALEAADVKRGDS